MHLKADNLRTQLMLSGEGQSVLATAIGKSTTTVNKWVNDKQNIANTNAERIAEHFGISPDSITEDEGGIFRVTVRKLIAAQWHLERTDLPPTVDVDELYGMYVARLAIFETLSMVPLFATEDLRAAAPYPRGMVEVPPSVPKRYMHAFAWRVEDDSFGRVVPRGSIAVFDPIEDLRALAEDIARNDCAPLLVGMADGGAALRTAAGGEVVKLYDNARDGKAHEEGHALRELELFGRLVWWQAPKG